MKLYIISSFHYDYIYLKDSESYFEISFRILDKALDILEKEQDWCFTIEQTILVEEYLRRFPEKKGLMQNFVQEGRLAFAPGMYVMPDMNMIDVESLCLQAKYGKKFLKDTFNANAPVCWIADCWGHHAQLPQILKSCGYEGYFFWRCMRRDVKKNDFFWQGLDGTKIFTHWLSQGYASINFPSKEVLLHAEELKFAEGTAESIFTLMDTVSRYDEGKKARPLLLCNGGDFRMPQETGANTVRQLAAKKDFPQTFFSTPENFTEELLAHKDLSIVSGEFNAAFQGTYSTNIFIKQHLHQIREQLLAKETFAALTNGAGVEEQTWKQLLRHYFHDTVCGTICDAGLKEVREELYSLKERSAVYSDILFNPLLRERNEIFETQDGKHLHITLAPFESSSADKFEVMVPLTEENTAGVFENAFFKCSYDEKGRIVSLLTPGGKEMVDKTSNASFGLPVMQMDNGDNWLYYEGPLGGGCDAAALTCNHPDPLYREKALEGLVNRLPYFATVEEYSIKRSAKECVILQKGIMRFWRLQTEFSIQISMDAFSPLIRYKLDILPSGKHFRLRAAFPTAFTGETQIIHGIPGGLQERPCGEYPAEGFIHYGDEKGGLFLLNRGLPGNNVDENGVMLLSLFRSVAMEYKCESAGSFNEGVSHTFEYAVLPHDGNIYCEENASCIENYLRPVAFAEKEYKENFWHSLPGNVRLLSMRKHSQGLFLRLCEVWGEENTSITLPGNYFIADALENCTDENRYSGEIRFKAFELKNLILKV